MLRHFLAICATIAIALTLLGLLAAWQVSSSSIRPTDPTIPLLLAAGSAMAAVLLVGLLWRLGRLSLVFGWLALVCLTGSILVLLALTGRGLSATDRQQIFLASGILLVVGIGFSVATVGIPQRRNSGDWIRISKNDGWIDFHVRQRRGQKVRNAIKTILWGFGIVGVSMGAAFLLSLLLQDENALILGFVFAFVGLLVVVAGVLAFIPAFWSLKEADSSSFSVGRNGIRAQQRGKQAVLPYAELTGPYYRTSEDDGQPQTVRNSGTPILVGGFGAAGMAAVGAATALNAASDMIGHTLVGAVTVSREHTRGEVYVEHMAEPVILAKMLSDREARFLAEKVLEAAEAMLKMAGDTNDRPTAADKTRTATQA